MKPEAIKQGLKKYPENQVNNYIAYLQQLAAEKDKQGKLKNAWVNQRPDDFLIRIFKVVADDGLVFDGDDITLQSTGVSYNYQAFKNKMLLAYPESIIDVSLVYQDDTFQFQKQSGKVQYTHTIGNPFSREEKDIVGAYCVIKNHRGEFLTLLSKKDIDKHRKVAKTDYIWRSWFAEMALKTIMKKACKQHFKDVFSNIEAMDNQNYDLEKIEEPNPNEIIIGQKNIKWLSDFCTEQRFSDEDKKKLKQDYGFSPYQTTPEQFEEIKKRIVSDYDTELVA
jgi:hypothetical protein